MTVKEYLQQADRLNQRINAGVAESRRLRQLATSISSPGYGEKAQHSRGTEAPFARQIEKISLLEDRINADIDLLITLKEQIHKMLDTLPNQDERLIIQYRYILGYQWEKIADILGIGITTVHRKHRSALENATLPENYVRIV